MKISLEIVPRSIESIHSQIQMISTNFSEISAINFPDLTRFEIHSLDACRIATELSDNHTLIPHIRAIDFDKNNPLQFIEIIQKLNLKKLLVIGGDPPSRTAISQPSDTIEMIQKLKQKLPNIQIYAAFDPYRNNIKFELDYLQAKIDAGASGFFSQPFFDLRLLDIYSEFVEKLDIFWGISPVIDLNSKNYWERRNRAIFPKNFQPTIDWNVNFAQKVLAFCQQNSFNAYLMPIKIDLPLYLHKLFDR